MNTRVAVAAVAGAIALIAPQGRSASPAAAERLPNFDKRIELLNQAPGLRSQAVTLGAAQDQAEVTLRSAVPGAKVSRDRILGTPRLVTSSGGFLTGAGGRNGAISATRLAAFSATDSNRVIKAFLNEHSALFGYDAGALNSARVRRDYVTSHNGSRTTVWEQTVDGIPVFEAMLVSHLSRDEELVSVTGHFVPDASGAAGRGTPNRLGLIGNPTIPVRKAIAAAAANVGLGLTESAVTLQGNPEGAEKRQSAGAAGLFGTTRAQLVWLPMNQQSMRLCWRVILGDRKTGELYLVLLDAETGEALLRHGLTAHIGPATYNVYTNDSPSPFSPGWDTPQSGQPSNTTRVMVTYTALSTNASPLGWINDGNNQTTGNNVRAFRDRDYDLVPDIPLPTGAGTNRIFNYPQNLNQDPITYANASIVQLFYRANWYHDRLYQLGFTEAAGNFQNDNLGRGGLGNDAVLALVQAGADVGFVDNATFATPPDGDSGICSMFIFTGPTPSRDGSLDQEVVCHELTHGLSNRLLGGGVGIFELQTEGMGEGWSDFVSLCLLSESSDDVDANYAAGAYVTYLIGGTSMDQNYYFGIRRYPYTTDMTKNPLTFKDIDPTRASAHLGVPINPVFGGGNPSEVHAQGEVWCVTLREVWANIVTKSGWDVGNELTLQLVTDGLKLGPANATFLEARDAIILADELNTGGDNFNELWQAFAKRGMGFSALCPSSDTTIGVIEAFDLPPSLGTPDGILEVKVTPPSLETMFAGETNTVFVRVTDAVPITNATINCTLSTGTNLVFRNDGVAPDQFANNAIYTASLKVPTNQTSLTLTLVISAPGKDTNTTAVTYLIVPVPSNDNFSNAVKVAAIGTNYLTNNKRATLQFNEPVHANISTETASLWWNYTPSVSTNVLVDTGNSSIRTVIGVYTNQTLQSLQTVASAAGTANRKGAFVKFNAVAGRTYHIAVASYDSKNLGTMDVTIAPGGQPDTNAPTVTISSPSDGQIVTTNRLVLTGSAVDPSPNPTGIKEITISVTAAAGTKTTTVAPSLNGPITTNWSAIIGLLPGFNQVRVAASDFSGNVSGGTIIHITYRVLDPVNDFFVRAIVLSGSSGTNSINTLNATKEAGEPNHAGIAGGKSAWWFFTPSQDGLLTLSTTNSTFDTVMGVYTGPDVSHLTPIASNDDAFSGAPGGFSKIAQAVLSNVTYRIAVDGYEGAAGAMFLTYSFTPGPIFHLTVDNTAGGSVLPGSGDYLSNSVVVLAAAPDVNNQFTGWDGAVVSSSNPLSVVVSSNLAVTAHFATIPFSDGFDSGDLQHLGWTTGGNKPWFVQSSVYMIGPYAARSGIIGNGQSSSLFLSGVFHAGTGSFDYRVSSEPSFDVLRFFVDGIQAQVWSGEAGWANFAFPITAGNHTLEWRYTKDATLSAGLDAAFIDDVNLPLGVPIDETSAAHLSAALQTNQIVIDLLGQTNQAYILQVSSNMVSWLDVATNQAVNGFIRFTDPFSVSTSRRFYRAVVAAP